MNVADIFHQQPQLWVRLHQKGGKFHANRERWRLFETTPGDNVVGESGAGKSRLFWEFTHSHRTLNWLIIESSSASLSRNGRGRRQAEPAVA